MKEKFGMKNSYMFFSEQLFEGLDYSEFSKNDISIPKTDIHIYEFECVSEELNEESKAEKLDGLSDRLTNMYKDSFQIINCESAQYFCAQLYPIVVKFETKLRYALYVSRSLFENGNVTKESFLYEVKKEKKPIEEIDFGEIYESIFTDKSLKSALNQKYNTHLTKADLLKIIKDLEENTLWNDVVGDRYKYIENNFLNIKNYRNDVMHSHLISHARYLEAKKVLESAVTELEKAITDKLITNKSIYSNNVNIVDSLSGLFKALGLFALGLERLYDSDKFAGILRIAEMLANSEGNTDGCEETQSEELVVDDSDEEIDISDKEESEG